MATDEIRFPHVLFLPVAGASESVWHPRADVHATANALDVIPAPLLDRTEVLRLSGNSEEEKVHIAGRYLVPRQREQVGLKPEDLTIPAETIRILIGRYTREGVVGVGSGGQRLPRRPGKPEPHAEGRRGDRRATQRRRYRSLQFV